MTTEKYAASKSFFNCALMCHAPIVIPEIAGPRAQEVEKTTSAMEKCAANLLAGDPETVIVLSPHASRANTGFSIIADAKWSYNFGVFGKPDIQLSFEMDLQVRSDLCQALAEKKVPFENLREPGSDHGSAVPLYFLDKLGFRGQIVIIGLSWNPLLDENVVLGKILKNLKSLKEKKWALLASGDMSHRLTPNAPSGYHPKAREFDGFIVDEIKQNNLEGVLKVNPTLREIAGEDVIDSLAIAYGALENQDQECKFHSYEGPFGVGYLVATLHQSVSAETRTTENSTQNIPNSPVFPEPSVWLTIARDAIRSKIDPNFSSLNSLKDSIASVPAKAVFVTLKDAYGVLRGCIGRTEPYHQYLHQEIEDCAILAATEDHRFQALTPKELETTKLEISILEEPKPISGMWELDPDKFGVVVTEGHKRGILLPGIETVDTVHYQLKIAMQKAGIYSLDKCKLYRFTVTKLEE